MSVGGPVARSVVTNFLQGGLRGDWILKCLVGKSRTKAGGWGRPERVSEAALRLSFESRLVNSAVAEGGVLDKVRERRFDEIIKLSEF